MSRSKKSDKKKKAGSVSAKDAPPANGAENGHHHAEGTNGVNGAGPGQFRIRLGYHEPQQDIHIDKITIQYGSNILMKDQKLTLVCLTARRCSARIATRCRWARYQHSRIPHLLSPQAYGRRYGLVGRNGSGKSSLLRMIADREFPGLTDDMDILYVHKEVRLSCS